MVLKTDLAETLRCVVADREELNQLGSIVSRCRNFIFILTDNIFESKWCLLELKAAIKSNVNIILLTKDGAK